MFGKYFGPRYFGDGYWGPGGGGDTPEPPVVEALQPTGGWDFDPGETPAERKARVKRERQKLGLEPPDPEPIIISGTAEYIGPAPVRIEPEKPKKRRKARGRDFQQEAAAMQVAEAAQLERDRLIAALLLLA